jgi:hypothetical protein
MDLTIRSFKFRVGSLGSVRLLDPINSGPLAEKTAIAAASETSIGSSSEINSPVSIKPAKSKESTVEELDEIMETLNLEESSDHMNVASGRNLGNVNNHSEEDFIAHCGDVSGNSEDT